MTHAQHPAVLEAVRYFVTTIIWSIALLVPVLVLHDRPTKAQRASEARLTNRQDGFQERLSNIEREFQSQDIERYVHEGCGLVPLVVVASALLRGTEKPGSRRSSCLFTFKRLH